MTISFRKYQGLGNDFILVDNRHTEEPILSPSQAVAWCDRNFGIGADGVIFLLGGTDGYAVMASVASPNLCKTWTLPPLTANILSILALV
jgi:diaminopimelate epimerase